MATRRPGPAVLELIPFLVHAVLRLAKHGVDLLAGLAVVAVQAQNPDPAPGQVMVAVQATCDHDDEY